MSNVFNETIFLKEDSTLDKEIEYLNSLGKSDQNKIKGSYGEKQLMYQLKKANEGMFVLRDINLEYKDMTAQIDFIVISSHHCYFVECKNYTGNIEINKNGEFVVNTKPGKKNGRVGIKSPLNQVEDQLELFKKICLDDEEKVKKLLEKVKFKDYFRTLVVFTNQENIIKANYAPREIRSRIIKVDEIVRYIKKGSELHQGNRLNKEEMNAIGRYFLSINVEKQEKISLESKEIKKDQFDDYIKKVDSTKKKSDTKEKKNSNFLIKWAKEIILGLIIIAFATAFSVSYLKEWANSFNKTNDKEIVNRKLTDNQKQAIDIIKSAYKNSKNDGFEVIHTSVCKEMSNFFGSTSFTCSSLPIEVNVVSETKMTIYKNNKCYTLEISEDGDKMTNATEETKGFVENDWCQGTMIGYYEWDPENDYFKKIGGYDKVKEMAMYYYNNGKLSDDYYDYSKVQERGGNSQLWSTYKMNVDKFFGGLTGKGAWIGDTNSSGFKEMVEDYYYVMK